MKEEGILAGRTVFAPEDAEIWFNTLEPEEFDAFHYYKTGGSDDINGVLRLGDVTGETVHKEIQIMKDVLDRSVITDDFTVFRGGTLPPVTAGSTIIDKGFMSTTLDKFQAEAFIDFWPYQPEGTVKSLFEIRVPSGSKGAWIDAVGAGYEAELLLQAGANLNVMSVNISYCFL